MLGDSIKTARKKKGLSQEELALRLHVVRQTVSKWEQGISVPDADLLIALAKALDTTVGSLLGEDAAAPDEGRDISALEAKIEELNARFTALSEARRKRKACFFILLFVISAVFLAAGAVSCLRPGSMPPDAASAVIGGADGPTAIFVTSSPANAALLLLPLLGAAVSAVGIRLTRKK